MTQKFNTLDDAIHLARFIHRKQRDKAGEPYFNHVERVFETVRNQGAPEHVQIAAILHDSSEDSLFTPQMLLDLGVPEAAVEIVRLLDRGLSAKHHDQLRAENRTARTYDEHYYMEIRNNPGAVQVKLADIHDNLQPWRLSYLPEQTQERLRAKYKKARQAISPEVFLRPRPV